MYILVYMRNLYSDLFLMKTEPVPVTCFYGYVDHVCGRGMSAEDVQELVEYNHPMSDHSYYVYGPLRAPECDSPPEISNRYAYTSVILKHVKPKTYIEAWKYMRISLHILNDIKVHISEEAYDWLEHCLWSRFLASTRAKRMCNILFRNMLCHIAEKVYDPDYQWRTGDRIGKTTLEVFRPAFERNISTM